MTDRLELYGTATCPYTRDMREWLEWNQRDFVEYDVEHDRLALARLRTIAGALRTVPVLVEGGRVIQIGWEGRGCIISLEPLG